MGKKASMASFPAPNSPRSNNEVTELMAQDSMNMVAMALHNLPLPIPPMAVRTPLACRISRMTIMRVRRTLSESETEKYGMADQAIVVGPAA